ncbi:MAG: radical SAM protein [Halieaceae bacterium]
MSVTSGVWPPPEPASQPAKVSTTHTLGDHAVSCDETAVGPYFSALRSDPAAPLALNIHLPFCPSRCLSCDRIAVVEHQGDELVRYVTHLERELARAAVLVGEKRRLARVHFSGGSPNHLSELALANIFSDIDRYFGVGKDTRFSMEINPRRTSRAQLNFLKGLGVDQIKLEVRDVDATVQRAIGRIHSLELLEDVISIAHGLNFDSISMDYLIGLPGQTVESCEQSIEAIISLGPDWLVCLPFHRRESLFPHQIAVDVQHLPSLADRLVMFNQVQTDLVDAGYAWVGLNAFVKPDHELAVAQQEGSLSLSVLGYGSEVNLNVVGIGLGALSELSGAVLQNHTSLREWHQLIESGSLSVTSAVLSDETQTLQRKAMRTLMCRQDLSVSDLSDDHRMGVAEPLVAQGYAEKIDGAYRLTELGYSMLPHVWTDSSPAFRVL